MVDGYRGTDSRAFDERNVGRGLVTIWVMVGPQKSLKRFREMGLIDMSS